MIGDEIAARDYIRDLGGKSAIDRFETLADELANENRSQNLVSASSLQDIWVRHFADSVQLLEWARSDGVWLDLGTGAGFPGLAVAIVRPDQQIKLVESRKRRCEWLRSMTELLRLQNCEVIEQRIEKVATVPASVISARAFAPLPKLLDLAHRFSTFDTRWLLPKGQSGEHELRELADSKNVTFHVEQSLTHEDARILVGTGGGQP